MGTGHEGPQGAVAPRLLEDTPVQPPAGGGEVWADLDQMAARIDALLAADPGRTPVLLTGPWGSGKTTLLRHVQAHRERRDPVRDPRVSPPRTLWFDAWRYTEQGGLLPALCWTLWEAVPAHRRSAEADKALCVRLLHGAFTASLGFAATAGGVAATLSGAPWAASLLAWLDPQKVGKYLKDAESGKEPRPPRPVLEALHADLAATLTLGWGGWGGAGGEPAVAPLILIDDLDRCPPDEALQLLDQLRTLLALGERLPCRVVFAVDRDILHQAVRHRFRALHDYDGNRYLEKVFPLTFEVSQPQQLDMARHIDGLVGRLRALNEDLLADRPAFGDDVTAALQEPVFANPRLVKRCLNRVVLFLAWHGEAGNAGEPVEVERLTRWVAAGERWPRLREMAARYDGAYWQAVASHLSDPTAPLPGPLAQQLVNEKAARTWLARYVFDGSGTTLQAYLAVDRQLRRVGL